MCRACAGNQDLDVGGDGENGVHKRRNGANGDETEKTRLPRRLGVAAPAASRRGMTSVAVGANPSDSPAGLRPPLRSSFAALRAAATPPCATSRPGLSVRAPLSPFLRL